MFDLVIPRNESQETKLQRAFRKALMKIVKKITTTTTSTYIKELERTSSNDNYAFVEKGLKLWAIADTFGILKEGEIVICVDDAHLLPKGAIGEVAFVKDDSSIFKVTSVSRSELARRSLQVDKYKDIQNLIVVS